MKTEEFEKCAQIDNYDEFMRTALQYDNLTMDDYSNFIPKIPELLLNRKEKDPILMYENIIKDLKSIWVASRKLPPHGPWHHGLMGAILIASLKNNGYDFKNEQIMEAFKRGMMMPAGACGFCGVCGAGTGVGIALSIILKSTPFKDIERKKILGITPEIIKRISVFGGPRCCILSSYTALNMATQELKKLGYNLPENKMGGICKFYKDNLECHGKRCPYYPR